MYQYYYRNTDCKADDANKDDCICWYDEGTGPLRHAEYDEPAVRWREKPSAKTHTPGPWQISADENTKEIYVSKDGTTVLAAKEWMVVKNKDLMLMAAAPELLDALEEMRYARTDKALKMADAAITKALGAQPNILKPCPFCGHEVDLGNAFSKVQVAFGCEFAYIIECDCGTYVVGISHDNSIEKWNNRAK